MENQIRSAELLVKNALSDPEILKKIQEDPKNTLKELERETIQQLPRLSPPDGNTTNWIWIVIVASFALVMLYSAWILGSGVTKEITENPITKSDTMLTIFMTVIGFLAGLLSPSPLGKN